MRQNFHPVMEQLISYKSNTNTKQFICIHCGNPVCALYKKFSNSVKTVHCDKCHKIADKYIEFESIIILVDSVLLSEQAFRHMLFNSDFKLHWKLSLVLLLLESFALWRRKRHDIVDMAQNGLVHERGFYLCCMQNIADYAIIALLLLISSLLQGRVHMTVAKISNYCHTLIKAITIANFSKFFLLPIMVWRENTTELGTAVHHLLVMGHHLFSLVFIFAVVSRQSKLNAALTVLPAFVLKQYLKTQISVTMEENF